MIHPLRKSINQKMKAAASVLDGLKSLTKEEVSWAVNVLVMIQAAICKDGEVQRKIHDVTIIYGLLQWETADDLASAMIEGYLMSNPARATEKAEDWSVRMWFKGQDALTVSPSKFSWEEEED